MNVLLGLRDDEQTKVCAELFDQVFYWEDFKKNWILSISNSTIFLISDDLKVNLKESNLYVRGPGEQLGPECSVVSTLIMLTTQCQNTYPIPGASPLNKLTQLKMFGEKAPKTLVVKCAKEVEVPSDSICKSISQIRSKVSLASDISGAPSLSGTLKVRPDIPTMFQERASGQEFKLQVFAQNGIRQYLNLKVESKAIDYRYANDIPKISLSRQIEEGIKVVAERIHQETKAGFFDLDYFIDDNGVIKILEWNNAPASSPLEVEVERSLTFTQNLTSTHENIILANKNDSTSKDLMKYRNSNGIILNFEDYREKWTFAVFNNRLCFIVDGKRTWPRSIYLRPTKLDLKNPRDTELNTLMYLLESPEEKVISPVSRQYWNGSKLLQQITSLKAASHYVPGAPVVIPESYVLKGDPELLDRVLIQNPDLIVKSNSGVRSQVVDKETFKSFDINSLRNLPVMFQKCYRAADVRVHSFGKTTYAKRISTKNAVDYRYASERSSFDDVEIDSRLSDYCLALNAREKNPLVGVDFLDHQDGYVCLEANPSPGWNWYYPSEQQHTFGESIWEMIDAS